ncbi:MAG: oligoendopeptidase F [Gracilibacteraceae bacterium]|jgi:oligoendopeptidase F|nr:oligoendopeptidase F [Gracilibacteraceae bacterium]
MTKKLRQRAEIAPRYKWDLSPIFADQAEWEKLFAATETLLAEGGSFHGRLTESPRRLLDCLLWADRIEANLEELYTFARMKRDEDNREAFYQGLTGRAMNLSVQAGSALSFIEPELLAAEDGALAKLRAAPLLAPFGRTLDEIIRHKPHVLSPAEEKLLAETGEMAQGPGTVFSMLNDADIKFGEVEDEDGQKTELTKGSYIRFLESPRRSVREEAFRVLYRSYGAQVNTLAALYNASVKTDCFYARARRHPSALAAALFSADVPTVVYDNLITVVHEFLPVFYRYIALRQKALGLTDLRMYDMHTPLVPAARVFYTYEQARDVLSEAFLPLGEEYLTLLRRGFGENWIDVYESEGKTSGAYSWGTYASHPYVLLNYQDTLDSLFTLAHEMGHALHTWHSGANQPHHYAGYKIFVAEVASTLNETLLIRHLLSRAADKEQKAYLLNHYLDQFRGTVFRQTMFAEFEKLTHAAAEKGESLTAEMLSKEYRALNELYYGPAVTLDAEIDMEWARIPHFYNAFYVYQYATGFAAATALADGILREGAPAARKYLAFLSGGCSESPLALLQKAGVDMTGPEPVRRALEVFAAMTAELEELIG